MMASLTQSQFMYMLCAVRLLSADKVLITNDDRTLVPSIENLHTETPSGMAPHELKLAVS